MIIIGVIKNNRYGLKNVLFFHESKRTHKILCINKKNGVEYKKTEAGNGKNTPKNLGDGQLECHVSVHVRSHVNTRRHVSAASVPSHLNDVARFRQTGWVWFWTDPMAENKSGNLKKCEHAARFRWSVMARLTSERDEIRPVQLGTIRRTRRRRR
ncbi:hypothetical protein PIB30_010616 [Stylosanthes scabra]|uniref:Uncharacterized protein n=1 Tax=Stylosanthes scabra TaxID=79078 RepID=A0ABU6U7K6_9FABA|nr:hypothetical protein [Stylosanthes scabra]